jgi:hypothetical protein
MKLSECCRINALSRQLATCRKELIQTQQSLIEQDAWEHWDLGVGPASFVGLKNGRMLSETDTPVVWSPNYVTTATSGANVSNGIASTFPDVLNFTACAVVKVDPIGFHYLITNCTTQVAGGICIVFWNGLWLFITAAGAASTSYPAVAGMAQGDWAFVVLRSNNNLPGGYIGGGADPIVEGAGKTAWGGLLSLGKTIDTAETSVGDSFAEFIIFESVLTKEQINQVMGRSAIRMAAKGLTLFGT